MIFCKLETWHFFGETEYLQTEIPQKVTELHKIEGAYILKLKKIKFYIAQKKGNTVKHEHEKKWLNKYSPKNKKKHDIFYTPKNFCFNITKYWKIWILGNQFHVLRVQCRLGTACVKLQSFDTLHHCKQKHTTLHERIPQKRILLPLLLAWNLHGPNLWNKKLPAVLVLLS